MNLGDFESIPVLTRYVSNGLDALQQHECDFFSKGTPQLLSLEAGGMGYTGFDIDECEAKVTFKLGEYIAVYEENCRNDPDIIEYVLTVKNQEDNSVPLCIDKGRAPRRSHTIQIIERSK
jgi:hypothetical protein